MASYTVITNFKTSLAQGMTSSQAFCVLQNITLQGHDIVPADYGVYLYITLNPGASNMEVVRATTNTANNFTLDKRGMAWYGANEDELAAFKFTHNAGEPVVISNVKNVYEQLVDIWSDQNIDGTKTFLDLPRVPILPLISTDAASKNYVDTVAAAAGGISDLLTTDAGGITVNVAAGKVIISDTFVTYAGVAGQALTDNTDNYIQLRYDNTLVINITGFVAGNIPIAQVTTLAGDITALVDKRPWFTVGPGSQIVDTSVTYGATIAAGDPLYVDTTAANRLKKALATTAATSQVYAIAIDSGVNLDTPKRVLIGGNFAGASGLTPNAYVYLSDTGTFTSTPGTIPVIVGWAKSATAFNFLPTSPLAADQAAALAPMNVMAFDLVDADASTGVCAPGFADLALPFITLGTYGTATNSADIDFMPGTLMPFFNRVSSHTTATSGGILRTGVTTFWRSDAANIYKNDTACSFTGSAPSGDSALGFNNNLSYLLVQESSTSVFQYSGISGTALTNVGTITLDNAVDTGKCFIFDNTNNRFIFVDGNVIRRFGSTGTTIDTVSIGTINDISGQCIGVVMIQNRVYVIVGYKFLDGGAIASDTNYMIQLVPTSMTR